MSSDPINPKHYKRDGIECINAIKAALVDGFPDYLRGNVLKYLWRYKERNGVEDLRKARQYLEWLIEESEAIAEASGASETPSDEPSEDRPPKGWRKMEIGEKIELSDMFWFEGNWTRYKKPCFRYEKLLSFHVTHIRKIETPSAHPKRYREPTQADLRDGPIECEVRDCDHEQWKKTRLRKVHESGPARFYCCCDSSHSKLNWAQCRIEVAE